MKGLVGRLVIPGALVTLALLPMGTARAGGACDDTCPQPGFCPRGNCDCTPIGCSCGACIKL